MGLSETMRGTRQGRKPLPFPVCPQSARATTLSVNRDTTSHRLQVPSLPPSCPLSRRGRKSEGRGSDPRTSHLLFGLHFWTQEEGLGCGEEKILPLCE